MNEKFQREVKRWKDLRHPNVIPLLGLVSKIGPYNVMGMVSPWMENGDLNQYLRKAPLSIHERLQLLSDVADALSYRLLAFFYQSIILNFDTVHSQDIIHGDLTGTNILINGEGVARLIGCGFSTADAEIEEASHAGAAMRWRAPELLPPLDADLYTFAPKFTSACDIYSFSNVALQVLSGNVPYHDIKSTDCVLLTVARRILPSRPTDDSIVDAYWEYICWCRGRSGEPMSRPCIGQVRDKLRVLRN